MSHERRIVGTVCLAIAVALALAMPLASPAAAEDYLDTRHSEVNSSPASSRAFVGSPSIVVLPNGDYLASHADFGGGTTGRTTQIFRSRNGGVAWEPVKGSPVQPMMWATIFQVDGVVYLMGAAKDTYGDAVISRSTDNGETWSTPTALLRGAYHTGDTPVLVHDGRIYKTYEENLFPPGWSPGFRPMMISADVEADLTDPASWTRTNNVDKGSVLEGNPILGPDGKIWNILRYNDSRDKAWLTKLDPADPSKLVDAGEIDFPFGTQFSKFFLLWDEPSQRYLMAGNAETSATGAITQRNHLDLYESADLTHWKHVRTLVEDDSSGTWDESVRLRSFSQPTAQIDGDDLLAVSRTAYDGAANYHDANRLSFHRYPNFRQYLSPDDELVHYSFDDPEHRGADVSKSSDNNADVPAEAVTVDGKVGDGIKVSDLASSVDLGNRIHPLLDGRRSVTVSAWIKPDALPAGRLATIFGSRVTGGAAGIDLLLNGSDVQLGGRSVGSDAYQSRSFPLGDPGSWHHLTAVWDFAGDDMRLFVDGRPRRGTGDVAFRSDTYEVGNPGQTDRIGAAPSGGAPFGGTIDEVRVFGAGADETQARTLAGKGQAPTLDGLSVNGLEVAGFNPAVNHYDVVLPRGDRARMVAHGSRGTGVKQPRRTISISDVPSEPVTFTAKHGKEVQTYTVTVRRKSSDTALAGVKVASGDARSFAPSQRKYRVAVSEQAGKPLDLTLTDVIAMRTWDGATATVVSQADPDDRRPSASVRVTAENGRSRTHRVRFDVDRQLVSASASTSSGDAPLPVTFSAVPSRWVAGAAEYAWDFGDGSSGSGQEVTHTYQDVGVFDATVQLTDSRGETDTVSVPVRVKAADRLSGSWSFEDTDVDKIEDASAYANDGTVVGADRVAGHDGTGTALRLNGSGGATLDDDLGPDLQGAPAITISAWIKPAAAPPAGAIGNWVFGTRISGAGAGAELYMLGGALRVGGRSQLSDPYVRSDFAFVPDGAWHHVTAVLDYADDSVRLYIDGREQTATSHAGSFGQRSYGYTAASQPDAIGRSPDGGYRFTGDLDDVQVHAKALTAEEIAAQATASQPAADRR